MIIEAIIITANMLSFKIVNPPAALLSPSFTLSRGIPPKSMPDGQISLQNHGNAFVINSGIANTNTTNTAYFR